MSMREFRVNYIFGASMREMKIALLLAVVSGSCLSAIGADPSLVSVDNAKLIAGLTVPELLALTTLASLGLATYCIHTMVSQNATATKALTQIAERMEHMQCVQANTAWDGTERRRK